MKEMFADANAGMAGLIIFVLFFIGLLIWLFRPGAKKHYKDAGHIPLKEGKDNE